MVNLISQALVGAFALLGIQGTNYVGVHYLRNPPVKFWFILKIPLGFESYKDLGKALAVGSVYGGISYLQGPHSYKRDWNSPYEQERLPKKRKLEEMRRSFKRKRFGNGGRSRKRFRGSGRRGRSGGNPVTFQRDNSTWYVSKRTGKGRGRQVRKFQRRVNFAIQKSLGIRVQTYLNSTQVNQGVGTQAFIGFTLGGANGTVGFAGDLANLFNLEVGINFPASELMFRSMVMDIEVSNPTTVVLPQPNIGGVVVDAYYCVSRKDNNQVNYNSLATSFSEAANELTLVPGGVTLLPGQVGVTPFDTPNFGEVFKIYKVQRSIINLGQSQSFMLKDTKVKTIEGNRVFENKFLKGQKSIFFIFSSVSDGSTIPPSTLGFCWNRSYHYYRNSQSLEAGAQH